MQCSQLAFVCIYVYVYIYIYIYKALGNKECQHTLMFALLLYWAIPLNRRTPPSEEC